MVHRMDCNLGYKVCRCQHGMGLTGEGALGGQTCGCQWAWLQGVGLGDGAAGVLQEGAELGASPALLPGSGQPGPLGGRVQVTAAGGDLDERE